MTEIEVLAVQQAMETGQRVYLNWSKSPEGTFWHLEGFRAATCSGVATPDGKFQRWVQDPYARVSHVE